MRLLLFLLFAGAAGLRAEDAAGLLRQGDAFDRQLRTQEALAAYQNADKALPNQPDTLCLIAKEYSLSMSDVSEVAEKIRRGQTALEYANRAAVLEPHGEHTQLTLAVCYGRLAPLMDNRTKLAYSRLVKEHADETLRINPNDELALHVLGAWNYELANLNLILRAVATTLYGHLPEASNAEAARCLQKSMTLNPARVANHLVLGKVYLAEGDKAHAREELQKTLALPCCQKDEARLQREAGELLKKL